MFQCPFGMVALLDARNTPMYASMNAVSANLARFAVSVEIVLAGRCSVCAVAGAPRVLLRQQHRL